MPDIVLPSVLSLSPDIGESALDYPLPWDTIDTAQFDRVNMVEPVKADLLQRSQARINTAKDFDYMREDIEQYKKTQADKTISLNEKQRLQEKDENEARQKARDQERLARKEPETKLYELTLKDVSQPGLPAPVVKTNSLAKAQSPAGAGVSTNTAVASAQSETPHPDLGDEASEEKAPPVDFVLDEAERILADYVSLLAKNKSLTAASQN